MKDRRIRINTVISTPRICRERVIMFGRRGGFQCGWRIYFLVYHRCGNGLNVRGRPPVRRADRQGRVRSSSENMLLRIISRQINSHIGDHVPSDRVCSDSSVARVHRTVRKSGTERMKWVMGTNHGRC